MNTISNTSQRRKTEEKRKNGTGFWYRFSPRFLPRYAEGDSAVPNPQCARTTLMEIGPVVCTKNPRMNTGRNHRYQKPVPILPHANLENIAIQIKFSDMLTFVSLSRMSHPHKHWAEFCLGTSIGTNILVDLATNRADGQR